MTPLVTVVGLGPAGTELVLPAVSDLLTASDVPVLFRTGRHPAAAELMGELRLAGRDVRSSTERNRLESGNGSPKNEGNRV